MFIEEPLALRADEKGPCRGDIPHAQGPGVIQLANRFLPIIDGTQEHGACHLKANPHMTAI